jgi:predicted DNA-binding protein (MmcQ/YjbR family)
MSIEFHKIQKPFIKITKKSQKGTEMKFTFQKINEGEVLVILYEEDNELLSFKCSNVQFSQLKEFNDIISTNPHLYYMSSAPAGLVY